MPRKKRRKSARKPAASKGSRSRRWRRVLAACLVGLGLLFATAYIYVAREIRHRIEGRAFRQTSAIYSDVLTIPNGTILSRQLIEQMLTTRGYRVRADRPTDPGEFFCSQERCEIATRALTLPDGRGFKSQLVRFIYPRGELQDFDGAPVGDFVLEPIVLAKLGGGGSRASLPRHLNEFPERLRQAVVAIEDERFFDHPGIDVAGIVRALWVNLGAGQIVQGGSTITQQLAKNLFLSPERSFTRKLLEVVAAFCLELQLTKEQILELYLNEVYLGQQGATAVHGMAQASQFFFSKRVEQLSLGEAALLAGIIKAPSGYSPRRHFVKARERSRLVLDKMVELGVVSSAERTAAAAEKLQIVRVPVAPQSKAHFAQAVRTMVGQEINFDGAVLADAAIYTGINSELQSCAERAVRDGLEELDRSIPRRTRDRQPLEVGLVAIEPSTGLVRAWVGGRDFAQSQFDHVNQAARPIGSTIKPFLYLTALDKELNSYRPARPTSILDDSPIEIQVNRKVWKPENYDRSFRGRVTLRYALENSLNLPAVYVVQRVGVPAFTKTLTRFGLSQQILEVPALALGSLEVPLLNLTSAYAALANGGVSISPRLFTSATDSSGSVLAKSRSLQDRVASESAVYVLTNILQGVVERGTGKVVRRLGFKAPVAGKTGTSNESRDAWFLGFTPTLAAGVWVGFDNNSELPFTGASGAGPIWGRFMTCAGPFIGAAQFLPPPGVVSVDIDATSGERATSACPSALVIREVFVAGTEPLSDCRVHGPGAQRYEQPLEFGEPSAPARRHSLWERIFG